MRMLLVRDAFIQEQNDVCLSLVGEIERIRATVRVMSDRDLDKIVKILQQIGTETDDANILVSASQLLQVVTDDTMLDQIADLNNVEEQEEVYKELIVSICQNPYVKQYYCLPLNNLKILVFCPRRIGVSERERYCYVSTSVFNH